MHCLEDDLELLEDVPAELKRLCCKMRHLDFRVESKYRLLNKMLHGHRFKAVPAFLSERKVVYRGSFRSPGKSFEFFNIRNALTREEREKRIARIHQSYHQIRKLSEDKIAITEHLHLMLGKYQERISTGHARIPSTAQQTIVGSTSIDENIVFKTAPSGNHPKQLQKRITHYFASLGEVPSSAISTNEHYAEPPKKKIPNMNMTLPSVRLEQFQTARKSVLWKCGVKTAGASLAESQKRILPNTIKISQPPVEAKSRRKSFIFPTRIIKETTKESKSPVFSGNATLPITVSEMPPTKERIEHCESLFIGSQDHVTDFDDTTNSRNSFVDILKVKSIEKEAFIWSDDEDY